MSLDLQEAIDVLRRTPATLHALLDDIAERLARSNEGAATFSPFDVVGHLIDGEETDWMPRARIILSNKSDKQFTPYNRLRHRERNANRTLASLLEEFARLRADNLKELSSWELTDAQLNLKGIHPTFGSVTLRELLASWGVHDLCHIAQIARVMAKQYRDDVGPWTPFLPVLTDHEAIER
ncbi:MAG: DinB family protein [Gemmatimonadaceae bacterium]